MLSSSLRKLKLGLMIWCWIDIIVGCRRFEEKMDFCCNWSKVYKGRSTPKIGRINCSSRSMSSWPARTNNSPLKTPLSCKKTKPLSAPRHPRKTINTAMRFWIVQEHRSYRLSWVIWRSRWLDSVMKHSRPFSSYKKSRKRKRNWN